MIVCQSIAEVTRVGVSCVGKWGDLNLLTTSWSSSSSWTLIKTLPKHWKHWKRQQNLAASASDLNLLTTSWSSSSTLKVKWWKDKRNQAASDLYLSSNPILLFFLLSSESSFSYSRKMIVINWANYCTIDDDDDDNDDNCGQSYPCTWFL